MAKTKRYVDKTVEWDSPHYAVAYFSREPKNNSVRYGGRILPGFTMESYFGRINKPFGKRLRARRLRRLLNRPIPE